MGGFASSRYGCTIGAEKKGVKFFFKFFSLGCGRLGVGAWVWVLGCGCLGVGVGRWVGGAGWGWAGAGWGGLDWDCRFRIDGKRLPGFPNLSVGMPARV